LAFAAIVPFAAVYAFYQNLAAVPDDEAQTIGDAYRAAKKQASIWQSQNWTMLAILALLNIVVFLNVATAILLAPYLIKLLFGIESVFTRSGAAAFNSTFAAVTASLTYLITNPLARTVYVLRYFYADSLQTGADLRIARTIAILLLIICVPAMLPAQSLDHGA